MGIYDVYESSVCSDRVIYLVRGLSVPSALRACEPCRDGGRRRSAREGTTASRRQPHHGLLHRLAFPQGECVDKAWVALVSAFVGKDNTFARFLPTLFNEHPLFFNQQSTDNANMLTHCVLAHGKWGKRSQLTNSNAFCFSMSAI